MIYRMLSWSVGRSGNEDKVTFLRLIIRRKDLVTLAVIDQGH